MMDTVLFATFMNFALITSLTPGPNNLIAMASGTAFGWRRTIPQMLGVSLGVSSMVVLAALGLAEIIARWPLVLDIVRVLGALWLAWLAWQFVQAAIRVGKDTGPQQDHNTAQPLTVLQAAGMQWVNPKAWALVTGSLSAYVELMPTPLLTAGVMAIVFSLITPFSISLWALSGAALRRLLTVGRFARALNLLMALMILATALMILFDA